MWLPPIKVLCAAGIMTALATCTSHPAPVQQPATPPGLPGAGTADVSQAPTGNVAHLAAVRLAGQDGFDRLVLEFADRGPGYTVGYRPPPAHADASGAKIVAARGERSAATHAQSGDGGGVGWWGAATSAHPKFEPTRRRCRTLTRSSRGLSHVARD
ncbi:MAG: AMIN-like domain-containing (lipo)protein [Mycobacterium sp.]